jgi:hypothetical protein
MSKRFALVDIFEFTTVKVDKNRYTIYCKNGICSWCFHASVIGEASNVIIRTFGNTDPRVGIVGDGHKNLWARVHAKRIEDKVRVNSSNSGAAFREDSSVSQSLSLKPSAKELAFTAINGSYGESYESLSIVSTSQPPIQTPLRPRQFQRLWRLWQYPMASNSQGSRSAQKTTYPYSGKRLIKMRSQFRSAYSIVDCAAWVIWEGLVMKLLGISTSSRGYYFLM